LIGATGSPLHSVASEIERGLTQVDYETEQVRLIDLVMGDSDEEGLSKAERLDSRMTAGSEFRQRNERGDALALLGIREMRAIREAADSPGERAYVITSLKNPQELSTLRAVYGPRLVALGIHCPREVRLDHLTDRLANSGTDEEQARLMAEGFIERDADEGDPLGQNIDATFHEADCFVQVKDPSSGDPGLTDQIERLLRVIFGDPFQTPTRDERAMFMAAGAAAQSAELTRQVGASVMREDGSIISVGCNEVPKFGGGVYWEGDEPDHREFTRKFDSAAAARTEFAEAIAEVLETKLGLDPAVLNSDLSGEIEAELRGVTEFGRAAHAEMTALFSAAAAEASVVGATVFTTTFPCHTCTRYMLTAGISRVVFVSPYVRSWAARLYPESIDIEPRSRDDNGERMRVEPFIGIAPRQYLEYFSSGHRWGARRTRSDRRGRVIEFEPSRATPTSSELDPSLDSELGLSASELTERERVAVEIASTLA
jgi:deoxycytidylate deaminase